MAKQYDHTKIEEKWLKVWEEQDLFQNTSGGLVTQGDLDKAEKQYLLFAFAYPSGEGLHVGHVESKTALDILARYYRMKGKRVFFPVGWDAFGLPAENYAIKTQIPPAETTKKAIDTFRLQIKRLAISYDWAGEIATSHPEYYKWTQWLFLKLYEKGLAYKALGMVNWCPSCQTVLANEQVVNGSCERCDTEVVQKALEQWYFKITDYVEELISGLDQVDWPEPTKQQQLNWIGKSEGLKEKWQVKDMDLILESFTTWPHTTWGATFMVVAPEHPVVDELVKGTDKKKEVKDFCEQVSKDKAGGGRQIEKEKKGVFTGRYVINPLTGWEMPIWVANFAVMDYGTGIVKACPAHDERDFEFARKYKLPIRKVIDFDDETRSVVVRDSMNDGFREEIAKHGWFVMDYEDWGWGVVVPAGDGEEYTRLVQENLKEGPWYVHTDGHKKLVIFKDKMFLLEEEGKLAKEYGRSLGISEEQLDWDMVDNYMFCYPGQGVMVNAGDLTGMKTEEAREKITKQAVEKGYGEMMTAYKLRDWLISRQRYWGAPIPIVYDPEGKSHPVKIEHLPWVLPTDVEFKPEGESPLKNSVELRKRVEELYGEGWTPEYDTMDTFVDSSWYYLRYVDSRNSDAFADKENLESWLPVDFYMIGPEHIVLHLLYSRFFTKFLRDEGYLNFDEPFLKMRHQGMILGPDHKKMSKSKGNVINPDEIVDKYGADTLRMYEMFLGPIEADKPWDPRAVQGLYRFLSRVWRLVMENVGSVEVKVDEELQKRLHVLISKIDEDIPLLKFNTAIASCMEFVNEWESSLSKCDGETVLSKDDVGMLVKALAPLAPFMAEELWQQIRVSDDKSKDFGSENDTKGEYIKENSVHWQSFPESDESLVASQPVVVVIQVNGRRRAEMLVDRSKFENGDGKDMVIEKAKNNKGVGKWLKDREIKKTVWVAPVGKKQGLVNFVV